MIEELVQQNNPIYLNLKDNPEPTRVESFCVVCHQNGETILLLTKIPFFKEMLIGSFSCDQCGYRNNEIQFVGQLPPKGVSIRFKVNQPSDLNREIVKSEFAQIKFEQLGLQIPQCKRAQITTVEGILLNVENNLQAGQDERKLVDHQSYQKIQQFIDRIQRFKQGKVLPFHLVVNDPSGNSNVKNPFAPKLDDRLFFSYYTRTKEQLETMGYSQQNAAQQRNNKCSQNHNHNQCHQKQQEQQDSGIKKVDFNKSVEDKDFMHHQPSVFQILCHSCQMPGQMKLCQTNIPHFTDLIIMSFSCDFCGAHSTDTKTSGVITDKSIVITLNVEQVSDLKRDLFKSESCCVKIPQIQLQLDYGTLGGAYTTVEGLIQKITNHMQDLNSFSDSDDDFAVKMKKLIKNLQEMMNGTKKFTLILEDPLSNSFLQNPYHPEEDKHATRVSRDRTQDEIDFLGINQMSV